MSTSVVTGSLRKYWGPVSVLLGPPIVVVVFVVAQGIPWGTVKQFIEARWADLATLWSLLIGVYVLVIAQGIKKAADEARARERKKTVVEELEEARNKIQQVGLFSNDGKWDLVRLRAEEVLSTCMAVIARWSGYLPEETSNKLVTATTIVRSIAEVAGEASVRSLTQAQRRSVLRAQLDATELLNTVLGQARKTHEKEGD